MPYVKTVLKKEIEIDSIVTIHYFEYMKDFVFNGESHDFWEFLYVDKGTVIVQAGEKELQLRTGDIVFHEPNEFHAIRAIGNAAPNLIAVSFSTKSPAISFFCKKCYTLSQEERALLSHLIKAAKDTFATPMNLPSVEQVSIRENAPFGSSQCILLYLELFLITVQKNHVSCVNLTQTKIFTVMDTSNSYKKNRMEESIQYMQLHICEPLTLTSICIALSVSRSTLQSLFHEEMNCGVIEYFNHLKIDRAKEIIRDGTMNFTEISYFLSYSSVQYFSKQFKKFTGMSPMEYATSIKGMTNSLKDSHSHWNTF